MRLKRAEFARMVGMSMEAIGLIERGETAPRIDTPHKIASSLNIPLVKLLDVEENITPKKKAGPAKNALSSINLYLQAKSPEQIHMIHDIARSIFDKSSYAAPSQKKRHILRDK
jgi:transcriptional regulator with XRE-family HTH domain